MATWEDGPEYAPLVRPREFAPAPNSELETSSPPARPEWSAPVQRPRDYQQRDLPPLSTLAPDPGPQRDAHQPFSVVASNMTGMGALGGPSGAAGGSAAGPMTAYPSTNAAWNGAHWSPPAESSWPPPELLNHSDPQRPFETSNRHLPQSPQAWPGLASLQQPGPDSRPPEPSWPASGQGANAWSPQGPGQHAWPSPGGMNYYAPNAQVGVPNPQTPGEFVRAVLLGIGVAPLICLALGLFPAIAPLTLIAAFFLRRTGTIAKAQISKFYFAAIGVVVVGSVASMLNGNVFSAAVSQSALIASLLLLIASFLAVSMALRSGRSQPPPPSQWG